MGWRKLLGFQETAEPPQSDTNGPPASRSFAVERDRMFDLALTSRLGELFTVPPETRDANWTAAFFAVVWNASLEIAEPPFFTGPDGFT